MIKTKLNIEDLLPVNQLKKISDNGWLSTGDDPQFLLNTRFLPGGWYLLSVKITSNDESIISHLYTSNFGGFKPGRYASLTLYHGHNNCRLIYLPFLNQRLRFDPMSKAGRFELHTFELTKISAFSAYNEMIRSIQRMPRYVDLGIDELLPQLREEAKVLSSKFSTFRYELYEESLHTFVVSDYQAWLARNERLSDIPTIPETFDQSFSIIIPVYNTQPELLQKCLESVLRQSYRNWELILVNDASTQKNTLKYLRIVPDLDERIKVIHKSENGHISQASNTGLKVASGDWVILLDHDDELAFGALNWLVDAINVNPRAQFIYSDEDKITESGERFSPHFKPAWNNTLLLSQNYICHLAALKRERLVELGGFRLGVEGSQDHDLFLRFTHGIDRKDIIHIPRILYHWRAIPGSTASDGDEKSYAWTNGLKAINDFLSSTNTGAKALLSDHPNSYRIQWSLPSLPPLVSIIVPTRDRLDILKPCIESVLRKTEYPNIELIIVDNDSKEHATMAYFDEVLKKFENVVVIHAPGEFNFSKLNNQAVSIARGQLLCLLNNDIEPINDDWLNEMVSQALRPGIGCVGAKLYYPNDRVQHGGVILGIGGVAGHSHKYFERKNFGYFGRLVMAQELSAVTAACLVVKKSIYNEVGGLNEKDLRIAFNDVDFCLRVRARGYQNVWTPYAELYHYESISRGGEDSPEKIKRFNSEIEYMKNHWGEELLNDPAYNENLTLEHENFSLR